MIIFNNIGFYFPKSVGFDVKFFIEFLKGNKKVSYFRVNCIASWIGSSWWLFFQKLITSLSHTYSKFFQEDEELEKYIPEDINPTTLDIEFLFSVCHKKFIYYY